MHFLGILFSFPQPECEGNFFFKLTYIRSLEVVDWAHCGWAKFSHGLHWHLLSYAFSLSTYDGEDSDNR